MYWRIKILVLCFFIVWGSWLQAFDQDGAAQEILNRFHVPGMAVGVIVDGKVVCAQGYGLRHVEHQLPVTEHTAFAIGSCTKAFTALLAGQLVDEGRLGWDDPISVHVPHFCLWDQPLTHAVTMRDLLAHRTGIPRHDAIWFCNTISRSQVLELIPHLQPTHGLREKFLYNNFMYTVAGLAIEQLRGESWEEVVKKRIFYPLGLQDASVSVEEMTQGSDFSLPYAEIHGKLVQLPFHSIYPVAPGGALNMSVADMLLWAQCQLQGGVPLVQPQTLAEMHTQHISTGSDQGYGLGWFVGNYRGHECVGHEGCVDGFVAGVYLLPKKNSGIVILTNSSSDGFYALLALRNTLLDELLGEEEIDWVQEIEKMRIDDKSALQESEEQYTILPIYSFQEYEGSYSHPAYGTIHVEQEGNTLKVNYGKMTFYLHPSCPNHFVGYLPDLLIFGVKRPIDATFYEGEMHLSLEPAAPPVVFRSL